MSARHAYIVAYDISHKVRLRRVHRCMQGYGDAVQYSVFRCELSPKERELLVGDLTRLIHHKEDRVLIVDLGPARGWSRRRVRTLGLAIPASASGPVVF